MFQVKKNLDLQGSEHEEEVTLLLTLLLAGMWESAVRLDGALRHVVEEVRRRSLYYCYY